MAGGDAKKQNKTQKKLAKKKSRMLSDGINLSALVKQDGPRGCHAAFKDLIDSNVSF